MPNLLDERLIERRRSLGLANAYWAGLEVGQEFYLRSSAFGKPLLYVKVSKLFGQPKKGPKMKFKAGDLVWIKKEAQ
jgi:hypothetical protein